VIEDDLLNQVLKLHQLDLKTHQFVLSGPFEMAFNYRERLINEGIDAQLMHGDAFELKT
jgi:hypothetical protein